MLICLLFSPMPIRKPAHACTHTLVHTERVTRSTHFSVIQQAKNEWEAERESERESARVKFNSDWKSVWQWRVCNEQVQESGMRAFCMSVSACICVCVGSLHVVCCVYGAVSLLSSVDCKFYARFPCVEWVAKCMCEGDLSFFSERNTYTESSEILRVQRITMNRKINKTEG